MIDPLATRIVMVDSDHAAECGRASSSRNLMSVDPDGRFGVLAISYGKDMSSPRDCPSILSSLLRTTEVELACMCYDGKKGFSIPTTTAAVSGSK